MNINDRVKVDDMTGSIVKVIPAQGFKVYEIELDAEFRDLIHRGPYETGTTITLCDWHVKRA